MATTTPIASPSDRCVPVHTIFNDCTCAVTACVRRRQSPFFEPEIRSQMCTPRRIPWVRLPRSPLQHRPHIDAPPGRGYRLSTHTVQSTPLGYLRKNNIRRNSSGLWRFELMDEKSGACVDRDISLSLPQQRHPVLFPHSK